MTPGYTSIYASYLIVSHMCTLWSCHSCHIYQPIYKYMILLSTLKITHIQESQGNMSVLSIYCDCVVRFSLGCYLEWNHVMLVQACSHVSIQMQCRYAQAQILYLFNFVINGTRKYTYIYSIQLTQLSTVTRLLYQRTLKLHKWVVDWRPLSRLMYSLKQFP